MGLFAKEKSVAAPAVAERGEPGTSFFGAALSIKGKVSGGGNMIVMGKFEGELDLNGELVIAPSALVNGEVKAVSVTVSGGFSGVLTVKEKIHLEKSAMANGRLHTPKLSMADGAVLNGEVEMKKPSDSKPAGNNQAMKK
jgi:cytoskeletal protein CcmA (bactofilin family)